jgi:hypothetical protein
MLSGNGQIAGHASGLVYDAIAGHCQKILPLGATIIRLLPRALDSRSGVMERSNPNRHEFVYTRAYAKPLIQSFWLALALQVILGLPALSVAEPPDPEQEEETSQ